MYDTVINRDKNKIGKVVGFMKRNPGVLVDYTDRSGISVRWSHKKTLEVINENE